MPESISLDELRRLRLRSQLLSGERPADAAAVVRHMGAVQAQLTSAARLAIRARTTGLARDDVDRAWGDAQQLVRTWAMRGTLHVVAAEDLRWIVALVGPLVERRYERRRAELGLDPDTCRRGLRSIEKALGGSVPLTRAHLMERLTADRVTIDAASQAPAHLLLLAAARGRICRGPEAAGDEPTYVLVDEWLPPAVPLDRDEALAELVRRHLRGRGPATLPDFATWAGLPARDARQALASIDGEVTTLDADGAAMVALTASLTDGPPAAETRLLGRFDEAILGYRDRGALLDPAGAGRILDGGIIQQALVADGRIAGTWRLEARGRRARLTVLPFTRLPKRLARPLAAEGADVGRFLGVDVGLELADPSDVPTQD